MRGSPSKKKNKIVDLFDHVNQLMVFFPAIIEDVVDYTDFEPLDLFKVKLGLPVVEPAGGPPAAPVFEAVVKDSFF